MNEALVGYLQQANHVNKMITLFEEMETQFAGTPTAPLGPKKQAYLAVIREYCTSQMPESLERLDRGMGTARSSLPPTGR